MIKKTLIAAVLVFIFAPSAWAAPDFSQMNPTVKVVSYKKLFTDQILTLGSGSGTVINDSGLIVSNHHVIFDETEQKPVDTFGICITFRVEEEPLCHYTARLIAQDKDMDIALLQLNPTDVFGNKIPQLKSLSYNKTGNPGEGSNVKVTGYPGSGGETVTITTGKISGFDKYNNLNYFKTDTDFDHGSSGGTVVDEQGNFIGIPTYIRSYAENVGYFLDLREAKDWVDQNKSKTGTVNIKAEKKLIAELARLEKANMELTHTFENYPQLSITVPASWKFIEINDDSLYTEQENLTKGVGLSVFLEDYPYPIEKGYLDELEEKLTQIKEFNPDYKKEEITFAGHKAFKISYSSFNESRQGIYIPYGYTLIGFNYTLNLDEREKQEAALKPVLDSIRINNKEVKKSPFKAEISFEEPAFSLTAPGGWLIQKNISGQPLHLLAQVIQDNNFKGSFDIYYGLTPKDARNLSAKDRLDSETKNVGKLVYKKENVVMDGLTGWVYIYEYEGEKYQEIKKRLSLTLRDGNHEFNFIYDDLHEVFDRNLPDLRAILESFAFKGEGPETKGNYDLGSLERQFNDIQHHRFAGSISFLADKGIVQGYPDGRFRPEAVVTRAEALKIILESKNHLEKEKGLKKEVNFTSYQSASTFIDLKNSDWFAPYTRYAKDKKILEGYADGRFRPEQNVTLTEALKMIFGTYEIPLWNGQTQPWYKLYMDKAYQLYLLPRGMDDPGLSLTRAQLAALVENIYNQAK